MNLLNQSVTCEAMTYEPLALIKRMGQKCWQSDSNKSPEDFCSMLIKVGHESVLEHASMSVSIQTDRGITHEIVRHRIGCSYSQESTRYVKTEDIQVIDQRIEKGFGEWENTLLSIEHTYNSLLEAGHKKQIARSILPNCLKADIGMTANFRAWRHFLKLRLSPKAHPMIRQIAQGIHDLLPPVIVSDICKGCGNKPYQWDPCDWDWNDKCVGAQILGEGGQEVWILDSGVPPPDYCFPLCVCKS